MKNFRFSSEKASAKKMKTSFVEKESEKTKKKNENSKESKAKQEKSTKSVKLAATNSTKSAPEKNKILVSPSKNITRNFKVSITWKRINCFDSLS